MTTKEGNPDPSPPKDIDVAVDVEMLAEVQEALDLLDFVVRTGYRDSDGRTITREVVFSIKHFPLSSV